MLLGMSSVIELNMDNPLNPSNPMTFIHFR